MARNHLLNHGVQIALTNRHVLYELLFEFPVVFWHVVVKALGASANANHNMIEFLLKIDLGRAHEVNACANVNDWHPNIQLNDKFLQCLLNLVAWPALELDWCFFAEYAVTVCFDIFLQQIHFNWRPLALFTLELPRLLLGLDATQLRSHVILGGLQALLVRIGTVPFVERLVPRFRLECWFPILCWIGRLLEAFVRPVFIRAFIGRSDFVVHVHFALGGGVLRWRDISLFKIDRRVICLLLADGYDFSFTLNCINLRIIVIPRLRFLRAILNDLRECVLRTLLGQPHRSLVLFLNAYVSLDLLQAFLLLQPESLELFELLLSLPDTF